MIKLQSTNPINVIIYSTVIELCRDKSEEELLATYFYDGPGNYLSMQVMNKCLECPLIAEEFKVQIRENRDKSHMRTVVCAGVFIDTSDHKLVVKINWTPYHEYMDMSQVDSSTGLSFYQLSDILLWEPEMPKELEEAYYEDLLHG